MNRRQRRAQLYQQAHSAEGQRQRLVLVFCGGHATDLCDQAAARRYELAPNCRKVVRCRKTRAIVEVHLVSHGDDTKRRSTGAGQSVTYEETIADHQLVTLKICSGRSFRKWTSADGFNPKRFNPDRIPTNAREMARLKKEPSN